MKLLISLLSLTLSSWAVAATPAYNLQMDLSLHGKHVTSFHTIAYEGIESDWVGKENGVTTFIRVTPKDRSTTAKAQTETDAVIGTIDAQGHEHIIGTPRLLSIDGQLAQITENKDGADIVSFSVVAIHQEL